MSRHNNMISIHEEEVPKLASSTSPHVSLADGDYLMCYIVRMSMLIA